MADLQKLTEKTREAMLQAKQNAAELGNQEIRPAHLLKAEKQQCRETQKQQEKQDRFYSLFHIRCPS